MATSSAPATSSTPVMSQAAQSFRPTGRPDLDEAVTRLGERARTFARMTAAEKAALVRACMPRIADAAEAWVATGCKAKGISGAYTAEEWLAGPLPTMRMARLLADSLDAIARAGRPPLGTGTRVRPDGRLEIDVFPTSTFDKIAFTGFRGYVPDAGRDRSRRGGASGRPASTASAIPRAASRSSSAPATSRASRRWTCFVEDVHRGLRLPAQDEPGQRVGRGRSSSARWRR